MSVVMDSVDAGPGHRWEIEKTSLAAIVRDSPSHIATRDALPSIGRLELDKIKKDAVDFNPRYPPLVSLSVSTAPLVSPTMYSGPPPPYSYPSSATSSAPAVAGYKSPPGSHRTAEDQKEISSVHRQSLPSIKEALGSDKPLTYSGTTTSVPPPPSQHPSHTHQNPQLPSASTAPRPHAEAPAGPPNPFSHSQAPISLLRENPYGPRSNPGQPPHSQAEASPRSASNHPMDPRIPALHSFGGVKSPLQTPRAVPILQTSQPTPAYEYGPNSASSISSVNGYQSYQPYSFTSQPSSAHASTHQPPSYESRTFGSEWKVPGDAIHSEEGKKPISRLGAPIAQPYGESVKRHLEFFDIEASLNDIAEGSRKASDFSHHYQMRSHQTQRSGPVPGSLPSLQEIDNVMQQSTRVTGALARIREVIISQQHAIAEQRAQNQAFKAENHFDEDGQGYQDDFKGGGGFAGADAKKRRGQKAAPPGRCHSCNRAETPEWRRGPDGARTLCNACGLHYAKLTRKLGPKASLTGSNLRPKNMDPRSPQQ